MAYMGFKKLEGQLAQRGDVQDPAALAAYIARKKYGNKAVAEAAKRGKSMKRHRKALERFVGRHG